MELVKNIYFNTDKLIEDEVVKISYTGKFFQENSKKVYIHYGFGNSWKHLTEVEMQKTSLGFQAEIKLVENEPLNLVFRNDKNEWDNNSNKNYSFEIEKAPMELLVIDEKKQKIVYPKKLKKSHIFFKKVKLYAFRFFKYMDKIIFGDYESQYNDNDD